MAGRVINPNQRFHDPVSGEILANGSVTFYENRTSTLTTIYSDRNQTVIQTNPYTLSANGEISGDVWYTGLRTIELKNELGDTVDTDDDVGTLDLDTGLVEGLTALNMIADLTLQIGNYIQTVGYSTAGDGGDNLYEIVAGGTGTADGGSFIDLDNGLQARALFPQSIIDPKQWGVDATGATDATAEFLAVSAFMTSGFTYRVSDGTYLFDENAAVPTNFYSNSLIRCIGLSNIEIKLSKGAKFNLNNQIGATDDITGSFIEIRGPGESIKISGGSVEQINTFSNNGAGNLVSIWGYPDFASFTTPVTFFDTGQGRNFTVGLLRDVTIEDMELKGGPQAGINIAGVDGGLLRNITVRNTEKDAIAVNACRNVIVESPNIQDNGDDAVSFNNYYDPAIVATSGNGPYFQPGLTDFANDGCKLIGLRDKTAVGDGNGVRVLGSINVQIDDVVTEGRERPFLMFATDPAAAMGLNFIASQGITFSNILGLDCLIEGGQINGFDAVGRREYFGCSIENCTSFLNAAAVTGYQSNTADNYRMSNFYVFGQDIEFTDNFDLQIDDITAFNANLVITSTVSVTTPESDALDVAINGTNIKAICNGAATSGGLALFSNVKNVKINGLTSKNAPENAGLDTRDCFDITVDGINITDPNRNGSANTRALFFENSTFVTYKNFTVTTDGNLVDEVLSVSGSGTTDRCKVYNGEYYHQGTLTTAPVAGTLTGVSAQFDWWHNNGGGTEFFEVYANNWTEGVSILGLEDGITAPTAIVGQAQMFVDSADGDLKITFGDGTTKTIVTDT